METNQKQGFFKKLFAGKKNRKAKHGAGAVVVDEHVHKTTTTTTTTTYAQPGLAQQSQHIHGPLVANPYAQPAHGQIFVPANTAVQANPETGALLPASSLNGPVILPTGPKVIPIATNYPAGQAGPQVIPPSGGFINNSGNPYLTQQTYGPAGVLPTTYAQDTYVHDSHGMDSKAAARLEKEHMKQEKRLEKEEMRHHKALEKEEKRLQKDEMKHEKELEKQEAKIAKDQEKLERQMEKDQAKLDKQLAKDQEKILKDQQKLENTLEKDESRLANNQMKLQNQIEKREGKIENQLVEDQMKAQQLESHLAAGPAYTAGYSGQPIGTNLAGAHGVKHVFAEETKQDAFTGQVLDHNVYHKDTRF